MLLTARQSVEMFHLVLLRGLTAKGADKSLIALKGGCNLRFYFGSVRYSEDIDFDVSVVDSNTLRNKLERLLRSPLVTSPLKAWGIEITQVSAPKQTETTQRWKLGLRVAHIAPLLPTKIEFSRRKSTGETAFEGVAAEVLRPYGLTQVLATRYTLPAAIEQKVHALASRKEPQPRDIFDLNLLFARADAEGVSLVARRGSVSESALENAVGISFDEFKSKVVAFLDEEQAPLYEEPEAWNALQESVVARLEALR